LPPSTVTLNETPLQCLDRSDIVSMAYATNRSALSQDDLTNIQTIVDQFPLTGPRYSSNESKFLNK
jgi:hypothetical protein